MSETPEEKARRMGVPLIAKRPAYKPYDPNPCTAICGECGLEIRGVMAYSCQRQNCPTGLGGAFSTNGGQV